jgi:hypothetical protein
MKLGWRGVVGLGGMAWAVCGCAPSALIRPDDPVFNGSSKDYLASVQKFGGAAATRDDALFLQAEGFYRYRYSFSPPNSRTLAAEIAVATTDFAPLGFWAASLEMGQFRMQAYDGAIQLYETLLQRFPESPRKPLVLYRLGWAYRNVSMDGFPRDPEAPFEEILKENHGDPLAELAGAALAVPYKTQSKASAWSILPGAGQMYTGRWGDGTFRLGLAAGWTALALIPPALMIRDRRFDWLETALSLGGIIGLEVTYTTAYEDAKRDAVEFNEAQESEFMRAHPAAP